MFFDGIYGSIYGSSAIYQKVFAQCLRYLSCLIGCDVFGQRYAFNVITYGTLGADIFFLLCCFYTVFAYQNEAIKCVCYTSFGILVLVKCCTLIKRRPIILENIEVIRGIYASADVPTASNFNVVDMCSQYSLKITRAIFTLYLVCASILYPLPWVNYLLTGQMELMSPVLIPGVDQKQLLGYAILYVFHCHSVFFGSVCFATCDILFTNSALHVMLFAGMIETKFDAINRMLTTGQCNAAKAKCEIMEVIMLHLDFMRYVENMDHIYFIDQTMQIACSTLCIVSLICSFFLLSWLPAYFLILTTTSQLFMFCTIGTIVQVASDRMFNSAVMSNWYLLPVNVQKEFRLLILFMERERILTIGGVWPLNVSTFVSIMRLIYSFAMMVLNFVR